MRSDNPWKLLSSKTVYQNPWIRVREDSVIHPSGKEGIYGVIESKDSVIVAALNEKNEVYLIRSFSYPAQIWHWELPGGGSDGEEIRLASKRELEEETGIIAETWDEIGTTRVSDGLMTEKMITLVARDLSIGSKIAKEDENHIDGGKFVSLKEVSRMVTAGEINEGQTITALYLLEHWLQKD